MKFIIRIIITGASGWLGRNLVRALVARHDEENGGETSDVRGMPLGYDPLSREDIQLVETWAAQGRPR